MGLPEHIARFLGTSDRGSLRNRVVSGSEDGLAVELEKSLGLPLLFQRGNWFPMFLIQFAVHRNFLTPRTTVR